MSKGKPRARSREAAAASRRPKDVVVIAGAPLSGAERWMQVFAPHLPVDCYNPRRLAESLGRADEPYVQDRARAILVKLVGDNIRNHESLAIVSDLHGDPWATWATGCLDRLREAGYRIRLLLIYCEEEVLATRARHRNLDADALVEHQREIIDQAALQAAKGARVELLHNRKGPPLHTHTVQDGAILYQHKLTLRPDVVWNQYRNEIAQRILRAKPPRETRPSGGTKRKS